MSTTRPTAFLDGPAGPLEYLTLGSGVPSTVFAHGLAGSIGTTRPFGTGVRGRRTFFHFRGHGRSVTPQNDWTPAALAADLRTVADSVSATRCLGVSLGAAAMCALLADTPDRFERLVFVLPAALDPRSAGSAPEVAARYQAMAEAVDRGDVTAVADHLVRQQPDALRDDAVVHAWAREQAEGLVGSGVARALRTMPGVAPLADRDALQRVAAPALVIAQQEDEIHGVDVARDLTSALGNARLEVLPPGGILWAHRGRVRELIGEFLASAR